MPLLRLRPAHSTRSTGGKPHAHWPADENVFVLRRDYLVRRVEVPLLWLRRAHSTRSTGGKPHALSTAGKPDALSTGGKSYACCQADEDLPQLRRVYRV